MQKTLIALSLPLLIAAAGADAVSAPDMASAPGIECVPRDVHDRFVVEAGMQPFGAGVNHAGNVTVIWRGPDGRWLIAVHE